MIYHHSLTQEILLENKVFYAAVQRDLFYKLHLPTSNKWNGKMINQKELYVFSAMVSEIILQNS